MRGMNTVFLVGFVGQDPEQRTSKAGRPWCTLGVATHRNVRSESGDLVEETDWHDVRGFGEVAEGMVRDLRKGMKVCVEGTLSYDTWEDEEGRKRKTARILADRVRGVGEPREEVVRAAAADRAASPA